MKKVKLTSVCRPKQWKSIPISELSDVGYPVYGANGVIGYYDSYNHEQETVIITCRGATCGTVNLTHPRSYVTGNAMCLDNVKDSVDIKYLFYSMQEYDFTKVISGTAQPQITRVGLEKVEFALPSLDVQREIVSILDKIDTLIEKRRLQLKKLDDLIKARFVEMFGDPVLLTKKWDMKSVESVCKDIYGGGTPSKAHPEYYEYGDIPWVSSKDMKTDVITDSQMKINQLGVDNSTAKMVPVGSVIMVIRSGILKHTLPVAINAVPITVNQDLKVFIVGEDILPRFLAIQFKMLERDILSGVRAVTADNIEFNSLKQREIIVPPIRLQEQFADFVSQIDKSKLLSGCRLFHSWAPENRDKPKHVGVPRRKTKVLRGGRHQQ